MNITLLFNISWIPYSFHISLLRLTLRVKIVLFMANSSLRTNELANFFTLGLKQLSASTLTHF